MPNKRFSDIVENALRQAGWFPGRNIGDLLQKWKSELAKSDGFELFPKAEASLSEFGGLVFHQKGAGITCAREPFQLIPTLAIYEGDRFAHYSDYVQTQLYPLGEGGDGHYFIVIGKDGRVFLIMDEII